jgi:hypothetical protein
MQVEQMLVGGIFIILVVAITFSLIVFARPKHRYHWENRNRKYIPPTAKNLANGSPEPHIRTHDIGEFYPKIGSPKKIGTLCEVNMQSGRVAIYRLANIERAGGVDWNWYDLEFLYYKKEVR